MVLLLTGDLKLDSTGRDAIPDDDLLMNNTEWYSSEGVDTVTGSWVCSMDGWTQNSCQIIGKLRWKLNSVWITGKVRNKIIRSINGNIGGISNLKIVHWNAGGKLWQNKLIEVEGLLAEYNPEICFISEANLWTSLDVGDRHIPGYNIHLPNTMEHLGHARLVLLTKVDLDVQVIPVTNDNEAAMLWVKVGTGRNNSILVGGIYRQHQLLGRANENLTSLQLQREQELRWTKIVRKWKDVSKNNKVVVLGDLNFDYMKWPLPDQHHEKMVDDVKDQIETSGFQQLVDGYTRSRRQQVDSCLAHVWSNHSERVLKVYNDIWGDSDHNVVGVIISVKKLKFGGHNIVKRMWNIF